jgi:hypothetical protein
MKAVETLPVADPAGCGSHCEMGCEGLIELQLLVSEAMLEGEWP